MGGRNFVYLLVSLLGAGLSGCHSAPLNGDWGLYTALSPDKTGTMTFADNTFSARIGAVRGTPIAVSGTFRMSGDVISLRGDDKSSPLGGIAKPGASMDYKVDWQSNNLAYFTYESGAGLSTFAIARNGAVPDANRVSFAFDTLKMPSSQAAKPAAETSRPAAYQPPPLPRAAVQPQPQDDTQQESQSEQNAPPPFSASTQTPEPPDPNQQDSNEKSEPEKQPQDSPPEVDPNPPTDGG